VAGVGYHDELITVMHGRRRIPGDEHPVTDERRDGQCMAWRPLTTQIGRSGRLEVVRL
jgi:hypothetical protein